jgi:hypothetical protein
MSQNISQQDQTKITLTKTADYREAYANSVQVRLSVWDFLMVFGTMEQDSPDQVNIRNFQGIYLSPQQAKALHNVLSHNLAQYEQTFGPISLDVPHNNGPRIVPGNGPIH